MSDFLTENAIYVVLIVALVIWLGIAWYLVRLERKVTALERRAEES